MANKKISKKAYFTDIFPAVLDFAEQNGFALPHNLSYDEANEFIDHEISLIENKAEAAAARSAKKKAEGDELRARILDCLNTETFITIAEISEKLGDASITPNMITSRLTQLGEKGLDVIEKDSVTIPATVEGGKSRKVTTYKRKS